MSSIKLSENPEKARSGVRTLKRTTATKASTDAVKIDSASIKTPMIAVIKMVNKCQASGDKSHGTGRCQMIIPIKRVMPLFIQRNFWSFFDGTSTEVWLIWVDYILIFNLPSSGFILTFPFTAVLISLYAILFLRFYRSSFYVDLQDSSSYLDATKHGSNRHKRSIDSWQGLSFILWILRS